MQGILRVGICDDEEVIYNKMNRLMITYGEQKKLSMRVQYYSSGSRLLESKDIAELDIIFLDIDMPELDGIETAHQFNRMKTDCKIIMLTSKVERFKEAFKIGAFRFVTKPIEEHEVFEALDNVRDSMAGMKMIDLYRDGRIYSVLQKDIFYIMVDKKSAYVYTEKYDYRSDETLDWWETELDERLFVRCHKGYIVNVSKIANICKNGIQLTTGERFPIARRRMQEVEQRLMEYDTVYR